VFLPTVRWMNVHQSQNKWDGDSPDVLFSEIECPLTLTWKTQIILSAFTLYIVKFGKQGWFWYLMGDFCCKKHVIRQTLI